MRAFVTFVLLLPFVIVGSVFATASEDASMVLPGAPPAQTPNAPVWAGPAGTVLFDNGPLINSPGSGVGGADESVLQSVSLGMNTLGFGHQVLNDNRIADDFTVPNGDTWDITSITFFAYQTGSSTTSTMTGVRFEIWDGIPGVGNLVFGDLATNRLVATSWSGIYRVTETTTGSSTDRPIMANVCSPLGTLQLPAGTYWIAWQTDGSLGSGPWAPPVTINGQATTGDGLQSITGGAYAAVIDSGSGTGQGFPFIIEGSTGPVSVESSTWSQVKGLYR
jgi:hypothetical protein